MLENEENKTNEKKEELIIGDTNLEEGKVVLDEIPLIKEEVTVEETLLTKETTIEKTPLENNVDLHESESDINEEYEIKETYESNAKAPKNDETKTEEVTFFDSIQASIIDQIVIGGASFILLMIFNFIMKLINLRVVDKMGVYVIIYIIVNIIYSPIMEKTKMNNTVGRKVSNIKLIKK
ncbi:RDD family protein [Clostridium algidicarnis]|uniref:RDD family protein n=1 Tax=Clostridium algidicarnis DSM 15099 TaxID=1121295 RepID=A0A2S6FU35_9CLOT|nr:RDD family protein [Clostridium algidicarnis]MBB6697470.1 RDD family protein [Clostridium algidicarnis]PPK43434.1 RDD family protein [Clostridium algidicarnis DSM 15099]